MNEVPLTLGPEQNLVGVLTPPIGPRRRLAILLLNAGVVHRIGPHRNNVKLARHLAQQGYTAVRFDNSGVGDSRLPLDAAPFRQQAVRDIQLVMDYLEREHGLTTCALYGICAGAANAYAAALADRRVTGVFMVDGYSYLTRKSHLIQFFARVRAVTLARVPLIIMRRVQNVLSALLGRADFADAEGMADQSSSEPTRAQFAADIQSLVDRGVRVALLFSGSIFERYTYAAQLRDGFRGHPFLERVTCHQVPEIDHLVTPLPAQRRLLELVDDWISQNAHAQPGE
jgi:pimeloyl-ACP methyl ester carboxylesterase